LLALALGLVLPACAMAPAPPPATRRVVIVGVDGATWSVISPLMAAGRMPHLARLYRNGSAGALRSLKTSGGGEPVDPASLWTSLVTGRPPAAHGITESAEKIPGRYALRPVTADRRRAPALWTIAGARGLAVGVSGWPITFPAERVNGFMIAEGYDPPFTGDRGYLYPPDAFGQEGNQGEELLLSESARTTGALDEDLAWSLRDDLSTLSRGLALYRVYQPRLAFFRFQSIDRASHRFWQYHETKYRDLEASRGRAPDQARARALADAIPGACLYLDEWLGMLVERLPEETTLLVVSTYGFRGVGMVDYVHVDLDRLLELMGLLSRGPEARIDWARTRLFNLDGSPSSRRALYINIEGREQDGSVKPRDAAPLREEAARRLRELKTDRGESLFLRVSASEPAGAGDRDLEATENLDLDPSASIAFGTSHHPVTALYRRCSENLGTHDATGIFLAAGGGIAPGRTDWSAALYDVAPTVLYLLGLDLAADMPGAPIGEILSAPPEPGAPGVASYDGVGVPLAPTHRPDPVIAREIQRMRSVSHLR
jgi:predicted AlkP superfamily phosphohydrolase/phosphomutase